MKRELTPEAQRQSELEQYRYFNVLVEDKKNGASKAKAMQPPEPGAVERGFLGIQTCLKEGVASSE